VEARLEKGEKLSFSEIWDYTDSKGSRVPPGKYSVTVNFPAKLENGKTASPDELTAAEDIEVKS
jgi:hypothetical protein